ncbi:hypothetical protein D3Y55_08210 [Mesorhizobium sp. DCY119]|nr:hypothetical protein D3Y55_08210 [Mesorhizobium sp. DCY119]
MTMFSRLPIFLATAVTLAGIVPSYAESDYPTSALADYVYGCMKSNGETRDMLDRCSCSIDVIASVIPYDHYVTAETFKRMGLTTGEASGLFKESAVAKASLTELKRAQAEADIRCF